MDIDIAAIIISLLSLVFSLYIFISNKNRFKISEYRDARRLLSENVQKIVELQADSLRHRFELVSIGKSAQAAILQSMINQQLFILSRQALFYDEVLEKNASDAEYAAMAGALAAATDPTADEIWRRAIEVSNNDIHRVFNRRGYASYLFEIGRTKEGRQQYDLSIESLKEDNDISYYIDGYTYRMWAASEFLAGNWPEFQQAVAKSKGLYSKISRESMRRQALADLQAVGSAKIFDEAGI